MLPDHWFSFWPSRLLKVAFASISLATCAVSAQVAEPVSAWSAAWQAPQSDNFLSINAKRATLREIITVHAAGHQVRLRLSNLFGRAPVTVGAASIGVSAGGAYIVASGPTPLFFDGKPSVVLAPGESRYSEPVQLSVQSMQRLVVSIYIPDSAVSISRHFTGNELIWSAPGDLSSQAGAQGFSQNKDLIQASTVLADRLDVDAPTDVSRRVVAMFGDSITDGFMASTTGIPLLPGSEPIGHDLRYPDALQRRADAEGIHATFVNAAISGNRLLAGPVLPMFGPAGQSRLERDVLTLSGVTDVVVLIGINDLGFALVPSTTGDSLVKGLTATVQQLHKAGMHVILGTLLPSRGANSGLAHGSSAVDAARQTLNQWIRSSGVADAVIDFVPCMQDPARPSHLLPAYDSGDGLHPNGAGYQAMANCVDLASFR